MIVRRQGVFRGFTLVEMMFVVAVLAVLLMIAAPSMTNMVAMARLKSANAQLVTGIQYARTEAVARNRRVDISFGSNAKMTCYVTFLMSLASQCDCTGTPGSVCKGGSTYELNTTQLLKSTDVQFSVATNQGAFGRDGEFSTVPSTWIIDLERVSGKPGKLRTFVCAMGRPKVCSPDQSVAGYPACPAQNVDACVTPP